MTMTIVRIRIYRGKNGLKFDYEIELKMPILTIDHGPLGKFHGVIDYRANSRVP